MIRNWKRHYRDFEPIEQEPDISSYGETIIEPMEVIEGIEEDQTIDIQPPRMSNEQFLRLLHAYHSQRKLVGSEEISKRAKEITQFNPYSIKLDHNSTISLIYDVISSSPNPIHINSIIEQIELKGWTTNSKYHKYSQVYSAIKKHYYLFERVGKGLFVIRKGFTNTKPARKAAQPLPLNNKPAPKLETLLSNIVKGFVKEPITPAKMFYITSRMGMNCTFSTVYRAMQKQPFIREGNLYSVA